LADDILVRTEAAEDDAASELVSAAEVAAAAREHIDHYHQQLPGFTAKVQLCTTIASALMVAHDQLFVSETASLR
jgi:hypothetical protein